MKANTWLHPRFTVGESDGSLFGGFIEHVGHAVCSGIYEPGHPAAEQFEEEPKTENACYFGHQTGFDGFIKTVSGE